MEKNRFLEEFHQLVINKNFYNAFIIDGKNEQTLNQIVNEIVRFLVCANQSLKNDNCIFCKRAQKNYLLDVVFLGDGINEIGKEEVKSMMNKLSLSAVEAHGKKIYVVANAENLKLTAANALLKFLEEPPINTYAILLTKDRSQILPTIKSRCKIFVINEPINQHEANDFEKILKTRNSQTYFLAAQNFKKMEKTALIQQLEIAYQRTIVHQFPEFAEDTLVLISDLRSFPNEKLAIENYFIKIAERL